MARLASLAAARAQPLRPALRRPVALIPGRRIVVGIAVCAALFGLAYVVARETPLFALREVSVTGAPAEVQREVESALRDLEGTSLVKLDGSELEKRLRAIPSVLSVSVDRAFPHTLGVRVVPDEPLAVIMYRGSAWVVSRRARVLRPFERGSGVGLLPRVWTEAATGLAPGEYVPEELAQAPIAALTEVPDRFPVRIRSVRGDRQNLTFMLPAAVELRLGSIDDLATKLRAARAVLAALPRAEWVGLAYLDVSLPQRPVAADKSQVSVEG